MRIISWGSTKILCVFNSLLRKNFQITELEEIKVCKAEAKKYILPANKIEFRGLASSSKKGKFEERNNKEPTSKESRTNLSNDKLKDKGAIKNKTKEDDVKKFRLNDVISDHDLQIKINLILKYVEKGRKILCEIKTDSIEENKFDICLERFNNSKLKDYFVRSDKSKSKLYLTYQKKVTKKESDDDQKKNTAKSS